MPMPVEHNIHHHDVLCPYWRFRCLRYLIRNADWRGRYAGGDLLFNSFTVWPQLAGASCIDNKVMLTGGILVGAAGTLLTISDVMRQ